MENFELFDDYAIYRMRAGVTLTEAAGLIKTAILHARQQKVERLLINAAHLTLPPPSLGQRYFFVQEWAEAASGKVKLALVTRKEMLDPRRFGSNVAASSRFVLNAFFTEEEAIDWLVQW